MMDNKDLGRVAVGDQVLVNEAPTGLHPSGFDPSRDDLIAVIQPVVVRNTPPVGRTCPEVAGEIADAILNSRGVPRCDTCGEHVCQCAEGASVTANPSLDHPLERRPAVQGGHISGSRAFGNPDSRDDYIADLVEAIAPFANQMTIPEMAQNPLPTEWMEASTDRRVEMMSEQRRQRDDNILHARRVIEQINWSPASCDTHPKGGDASAAPFMGSAIGEAETPKPCSHPEDQGQSPGEGVGFDEGAIRIAIWNRLRQRGMAQDACYPIINDVIAALQPNKEMGNAR